VNPAPVALVASSVAFAGTVTTGPVVSVTVTVNDAAPVFPFASVAVQLTVVGPRGNVAPLAGVQVTGRGPSTTSLAVAVKLNAAPVAPVASTVAFAGTVTTGPVVSATVTVNDAAPLFPFASVAVQLTVVGPSGKVDPLAGVQVTARSPSTTSLADAVKLNAAPVAAVASTVAFAGTVTTGPVVSATVTVNDAAPVFPFVSVVVQVTVVAPSGNVDPLAGVQVTGRGPSTTSLADAVKLNAAPVVLVASTVAFAGTVTTGPVVSVTVTVKEAAPLLPVVSVTVQLTVVGPSGKVDPLAGVQVTARGPSTPSLADAVKLNAAPVPLVASTVAFAGTVTTGPVVSVTVTVKEADPLLAFVSVAVHVTVVGPSGNVDPLAGVQVTGRGPSTPSLADAVKLNVAPVAPVASTVAFAGTVTTGPIVSATVTVKEAAPLLALVSVAVHVTVVGPSGNVDPLAGVQVTGRGPSTRSAAVAV
jgi:uncharacterized protein YhbP (UPF0306 family)